MDLKDLIRIEKKFTVKLFILNEKKELLMVHERGEEGRKRRGSGLPGGSVDKPADEVWRQIARFMPVYGFSEEDMAYVIRNKPDDISWIIFLTAIKEAIEETGYLVFPFRNLFSEPTGPAHEIKFLQARIIGGKMSKRSIETDDCGWFRQDNLPCDTYFSYPPRIKKGMDLIREMETVNA